MKSNMTKTSPNRYFLLLTLLAAMWMLHGNRLAAQSNAATLSGVVIDATGARIPDAALTLTNDKSSSTRKGVTNGDGVYSFPALEPGTYTLRVSRNGFKAVSTKGIVLHPADARSMDITLTIGEATEDVSVNANDAPPTNGERTALISASDIEHLSVEGRDVSELVKTQAGFAIAPTGGGGASNAITNGTYDPGQVTVGGGLGNFVANGAPTTGVNITANGADITDPTSGNGTTQNINQEMVSEVQIQTSAFGADQAKGPIVVNAVTKSGGANYHGEVYTYFRDHNLNTQNWFSKNQSLPDAQDRDVYPGANFGGPVRLPFSNFNRSKRLTFFVGAEDYAQRNVYAYGNVLNSSVLALVPTANMRQGNFSQGELANYLGTDITTLTNQCTPSGTMASYIHLCGQPSGSTNNNMTVASGIIPVGGMDPGASALLNALPLPNRPTINGYNYLTTNFENNDLWQAVSRVDDAVSDRFKYFISYSAERGRHTGIPETQYYSAANGGPSMGGVDTPGKSVARIFTQYLSFNTSYVLSATMVNEAYVSAALNRNDFNLQQPQLLQASNLGYTYAGIYPNATKQIPEFYDYNFDGLPIALYPDLSNGPFFQHTFTPTFGDNLSKTFGRHSLKFGVYVQRATSNVTAAPYASNTPVTNGLITQYYLPNGTKITNPDGTQSNTLMGATSTIGTANYLADFAIGDITQFFQQNQTTNLDLYFWNTDFYGTDTWQATRKLTLTLGLRFDHLGPWQDQHGNGIAIFSPELYNSPPSQMLPGLDWHGIDHTVPNSGAPGRLFFYSPRFGMAYDLFGTGNTVLRGGIGLYRSHDSGNDYAQAASTAQGIFVSTVGGSGVHLSKLTQGTTSLADCVNPSIALANSHCPSLNATVYGVDRHDDEQPLTYTYNFAITQRLPRNAVFQIAYVGSQSHDLLLEGTLQNVNALPIGALFAPDPITGAVLLPTSLSIAQQGDYRPYKPYQAVDVPRHLGYSNYNALQTAVNRSFKNIRYGVNYTWSKSLGIRSVSGQPGDPIYLRNNYGPLNSDRSNIANATYSFDFGMHHLARHRFLGSAVNGWELSGITGYQSGPNLQAVYSLNFKLKGAVNTTSGSTTTISTISNTTYLGTPEVSLQPFLTCNPSTGLKAKQYVNGSCFALPPIGTQNGGFNFPYLHGPAYFDTDLTLVKNFTTARGRNLQLRLAGFNFLNHPINSFSARFSNESALYFSGNSPSTVALSTPTANCSVVGSTCFGYAGYKQGRRVVEIAAKYSF